jgi:hypothetical protein
MDLSTNSAQAISLSDESSRRQTAGYAVEIYPEFTLAFIEFDDQGRLWSRAQLDLLDRTLDSEAGRDSYEGVTLIFFAHGWQHDASACDANVTCFRTFLAQIASDLASATGTAPGHEKPPRVVGIYAGWRGRSVEVPILADFTFWARKRAAERIGAGELVELLTHLDQFVKRQNAAGRFRSGLNVVGHSLGGTMVYAALANVLKSRVVEALGRQESVTAEDNVIAGFGDLVVLVNPAFEASLYAPFEDILARFNAFSRYQSPVLIVVEGESDTPNRTWFRIGRGLDVLFERTGPRSSRTLLTTAVGNYEPFVTHRLEALTTSSGDTTPTTAGFGAVSGCDCRLALTGLPEAEMARLRSFISCERSGMLSEDRSLPEPSSCAAGLDMGRARLTCRAGLDPARPFWVVRATDAVVQGHSGIFTGPLLSFVRYEILEARMKNAARLAKQGTVPNAPPGNASRGL